MKPAYQHFNQETEQYAVVWENIGGGQRESDVDSSYSCKEILYLLVDLFCPDWKSSRGPSCEMEFYLPNYRCQVICEYDFTPGKYICTNKLSKPQTQNRLKTEPTDPPTHDVKKVLNLYNSTLTPKHND